MAYITKIKALEILDSRANPTIQATVTLSDGNFGTFSCPSGTSVAKHEAVELRDNDKNRYNGQGVLKALDNIHNIIAPKLIGMEAGNQQAIDDALIALDGTESKSRLGANALLSISIAICKASAKSFMIKPFTYIQKLMQLDSKQIHIPTPIFNILNGGMHAGQNVDFQEFIIIPNPSLAYTNALVSCVKVYTVLREILERKKMSILTGYEGGFAPTLASNKDGLVLLREAIEQAGFNLGSDMFVGLDAAANTFFKEGAYRLKERPTPFSTQELISYYIQLYNDFGLYYLEDGLNEEDWHGWSELTKSMGQHTLIVGDDLVSTNKSRLEQSLSEKAITAVIIKPNQIGTLTEALMAVKVAQENNIKIIVSHRSGETTDDFIADFAVGVCADYVKFGAPSRGERVIKYNRLLQIVQEVSET